jgi:catechol 2,3-dioxygenase-like lactoylglutathione lyase family enzyme
MESPRFRRNASRVLSAEAGISARFRTRSCRFSFVAARNSRRGVGTERFDHTAIGISNTDASLKFYRDLLGLRKAGESENFGTEQEHLNQVFGAHLRITGMRADAGPGIEFLEYLTPRDGRARPSDLHANDIVHWQTTIATGRHRSAREKLTRRTRAFCFTWHRHHAAAEG